MPPGRSCRSLCEWWYSEYSHNESTVLVEPSLLSNVPMTGPFRFFIALSLFLLPTVMFGGYSLLRLIPKNKLTPEQHAWFRAGHAHAGE